MDNVSVLVKVLGEENEKRVKDEITNMIIEQVRSDIENYDDWIIPLEDIIEELNNEIYLRVKDMFMEKYTESITEKLGKTLDELFKK